MVPPRSLARWAPPVHRNQKHLRLDFFVSSFAGSFVTGDGSCLGGKTAPIAAATAAGELGVVSPSIWLSTCWKRPSCCRKSCSTLRVSGQRGLLEGITSYGTRLPLLHTPALASTPERPRGAQTLAPPWGAEHPAHPQDTCPGSSAPLQS